MKLLFTFLALAILSLSTIVIADDDYGKGPDVAPVINQLYADECGSCHFAYQPGFLPSRSWQQVMDNLDDHFGENAELEDNDHQAILSYLAKNAGDHSNYRRAKKFMRSIRSGQTPIRISKVPYFVHEHDEIPKRIIQKEDVRSLSNCDACHQRAHQGSYKERELNIPGYGRWDD